MNYETMTIDDIIEWCQENGQDKIDWLKRTAAKKTKCKVYPRIKVTNEKGKVVSIADKSQKPIVEERPISFFEIKKAFAEKYMAEILPKSEKVKTPSMHDRIANL